MRARQEEEVQGNVKLEGFNKGSRKRDANKKKYSLLKKKLKKNIREKTKIEEIQEKEDERKTE